MDALTDHLRLLVYEHGCSLPKRHGVYKIFRFPNEGTKLVLDTWNGSLHYTTEVDNKSIFYFGLNNQWDRSPYNNRQPDNVVKFYIDKLQKELIRSNK